MDNILLHNPSYLIYLAIFALIAYFILLFLVFKYKKAFDTSQQTVKEKEDKIKYLRQTHAEYEYNKTEDDHRHEKEIIALNHTIEQLELKLSEGTKNQVVAKIEALQNQRNKQREHTGLAK